MFHIGHLNILKRSREMCDRLIVGVSTDELCVQYKHKSPVIPFEQRKAIIEAIRYVDSVVPQTDRDKFLAWGVFHFDRLFVGSDWKGTDFFAGQEAKFVKVGVEVIYIPYTDGVNSSMLRQLAGK